MTEADGPALRWLGRPEPGTLGETPMNSLDGEWVSCRRITPGQALRDSKTVGGVDGGVDKEGE